MKRAHSARRRILIRQTPVNFICHLHIRNLYDASGWHSGGVIVKDRPNNTPCLFRHGRKLTKRKEK